MREYTGCDASAERLVHKPDMSISEIAELTGDLNQEKYIAAFRARFGETSHQYRKNKMT